MIVATAFFDALGVASILPFIHIIMNQNSIETNQIISFFYQKFGILGVDTPKQFIFFFWGSVFCIINDVTYSSSYYELLPNSICQFNGI